eukprot:gene3533-7027_t
MTLAARLNTLLTMTMMKITATDTSSSEEEKWCRYMLSLYDIVAVVGNSNGNSNGNNGGDGNNNGDDICSSLAGDVGTVIGLSSLEFWKKCAGTKRISLLMKIIGEAIRLDASAATATISITGFVNVQ